MNLFLNIDFNEKNPFLNEDETHHISKVLRKNNGDIVNVTDGKGTLYKTEIVNIDKKRTLLKILEKHTDLNKKKYYLHIAIAPTKNISRFEWFIEKSTEIGVHEITPIICEKSERRNLRHERLEKIAASALKQSFNTILPKINEPCRFYDLVGKENDEDKFIAYCGSETTKVFLPDIMKKKSKLLVLIGPEGDFSFDEIQFAKKNGFRGISLGNNRLRTETAGITVCNIVDCLNYMKDY